MQSTAYCNELFDKYKALLEDFSEAIKTYEGSIKMIDNCINLKEYEDIIYWAKRAKVCYFT